MRGKVDTVGVVLPCSAPSAFASGTMSAEATADRKGADLRKQLPNLNITHQSWLFEAYRGNAASGGPT